MTEEEAKMAAIVEQRSKPRELKPEEVLLVRMLELELDPDIGILKPAEVVGLGGEFKSTDIFRGFEDRLDRQADVLESSCGAKRASAKLKDVKRASEDLDDAERSGVDTTPDIILKDVTVADLVRHQDAKRVFALAYLHPWPTTRNERTKQLMLELLTTVLELKLLTQFEFLWTIGFKLLSSRRAPEEILWKLQEGSLTMGETVEKARHEWEKDKLNKTKQEAALQTKSFVSNHFLTIFKVEIMVECFELEDLNRVLLAVAEKFKWLPEKVEPQANDADDESRATRRPPEATTPPLDDPGTPVESIAPPAAPVPAGQASEDDVEDIVVTEGLPSGTLPVVLDPAEASSDSSTANDDVDVDAAFDELMRQKEAEEKERASGRSSGAVPLSRPGDEAMVSAVNKEVAEDWKTGSGRNDPTGSGSGKSPSSPGSGSRSSSALKPR